MSLNILPSSKLIKKVTVSVFLAKQKHKPITQIRVMDAHTLNTEASRGKCVY